MMMLKTMKMTLSCPRDSHFVSAAQVWIAKRSHISVRFSRLNEACKQTHFKSSSAPKSKKWTMHDIQIAYTTQSKVWAHPDFSLFINDCWFKSFPHVTHLIGWMLKGEQISTKPDKKKKSSEFFLFKCKYKKLPPHTHFFCYYFNEFSLQANCQQHITASLFFSCVTI